MIMSRPCSTQPVTYNANKKRLNTKWHTLKPKNMSYIAIINSRSDYYSLRLNEKSPYPATFACQCGKYRFTKLSFGVVLAGDMFQEKIDKMFKYIPHIFHMHQGTIFDKVISREGVQSGQRSFKS